MKKDRKEFVKHIEDLIEYSFKSLKNLLKAYIVTFLIVFTISKYLFHIFLYPVKTTLSDFSSANITTFKLTDAFITDINLCTIASFIIISPYVYFILYNILYIKYLKKQLKRIILFLFIKILLLSTLSFLYTYFIFIPCTSEFFINYTELLQINGSYSLDSIIAYTTKSVLLFGGIFQIPLFLILFSHIGLVDSGDLSSKRVILYPFLIITSFLFSAHTIKSTMSLCLPLIILFEFMILLLKMYGREAAIHYDKHKLDLFK